MGHAKKRFGHNLLTRDLAQGFPDLAVFQNYLETF